MLDSALNYFIVMGLVFIFSHFVLSKSGFIKSQLNIESTSNINTLDGLRGILATAVFFHHALITYYYQITPTWKLPPSLFYSQIGQIAVILFFMITGFLFWKKVLQNPDLDIKKLIKSRIKRIVPLYIFSTLILFLIVGIISDFKLQVNYSELLVQLLKWLSFDFFGNVDINNVKDTFVIESVYWTLRFEWLFYFLLPILAISLKKTKYLVGFIMAILYFKGPHFFLYFIYGMIAAEIVHNKISYRFFTSLRFRIMSLIAFASIFLFMHSGYSKWPGIFSFIFFISIVHGNTIFGLLTSKAARTLGYMSYSIYLLHNIVIFIIFNLIDKYVKQISEISTYELWAIILGAILIVVSISNFTYQYIEHKFYVSSSVKLANKK